MKKLLIIIGAAIVIFLTCTLIVLSEAKAEDEWISDLEDQYLTYLSPKAEVEWDESRSTYPLLEFKTTGSLAWTEIYKDDLTALLKECLEYIPDGSDIEHEPISTITCTPAIYTIPQPWTEPGPITKAEQEVKRLKRQTELNKKIKEIIKHLEGEK